LIGSLWRLPVKFPDAVSVPVLCASVYLTAPLAIQLGQLVGVGSAINQLNSRSGNDCCCSWLG